MGKDLRSLAEKHGLRLILQFGSSVSGVTHPRSDMDIGVQLHRAEMSLSEYADLQQDLQAAFPGREVDLAILNRADPLFLKKIVEASRVLYDPDSRFPELKIYAFRRYQDHRRFLDMERRHTHRFLSRIRSEG